MRERFSVSMVSVLIAGAAATFALVQTGALAAAQADKAAQSAASIPDFSGIWAHPGLGFRITRPLPHTAGRSTKPRGIAGYALITAPFWSSAIPQLQQWSSTVHSNSFPEITLLAKNLQMRSSG